MTCPNCGDKGLTRLNWADAVEYALCLCPVGLRFRSNTNNGRETVPLWHLWCAQYHVEPSLIRLLEDVLTPAELAEKGFTKPSLIDREAALLAAGKATKKP